MNRVARAHNFYSCYNQANVYGCFLGHLERWISAVFQTDFVEAHNQRRLFGLVGWGGATKEPLHASQACAQCYAQYDNRRAIIITALDAEAILRAGALLLRCSPPSQPTTLEEQRRLALTKLLQVGVGTQVGEERRGAAIW